MKEYAQNLYDVADYTENEDGAHDALGTAITDNSGTFTTPEEYTAATAALKAAATTYAAKADPKGDAKFNITFMLTNPDLTGLPTWQKADGWDTEEGDGNSQVMVNDEITNGDKSFFYEYWSNPAKASNNFALYLNVDLTPGTYNMSCYAFAKDQYTGINNAGVYFYANDTQGSVVNSDILQPAAIEFVNTETQNVKVGLKTITGNTYNWMGIGYVELYKVAPKAFIISENETYDNTQEGAGDVELTRTIKEGMNSVVLPFALTAADIVNLGGEGAVAYTVSEYANDNLKLAEAETVSPNTPFFLKATAAGTEFDFEGKTIAAEEPVVTVGDATLVGTYAKIDAVPEDSYILSGGKFYKVNSTVSLKPTRAYITIAEPTEVSALGFTFEDATAIVGVESETVNGEVYDIAGRKVSAPVRGLYIANGKKVLVK